MVSEFVSRSRKPIKKKFDSPEKKQKKAEKKA